MTDIPVSMLEGKIGKVALGRGRMFLDEAPGFRAREYYCRYNDWTEVFERGWRDSLPRFAALCKQVGAQLIVIVAPDAHVVHSADLPEDMPFTEPSIGQQFVDYVNAMGIEAHYPRALLEAAVPGPVDVYRRNDTHWSAYGGYVAYRLLMDRITTAKRPHVVGPDDFTYVSKMLMGDLGWTTDPPYLAEKLIPTITNRRSKQPKVRFDESRDTIAIAEIDDPSLPSCVMMRDSFATEMGPFIADSFRRTVFAGVKRQALPELILDERPDVVIIERGERAIANGFVDWNQMTYREIFPEPGKPAAMRLDNEARLLLRDGNYPAAIERAVQAVTMDPTADHYFTLARGYMAAKAPAEAERALLRCVAIDSQRFSFRLHLGIVHLQLARPKEAQQNFAHAVVLAPHHPLGYEHFGYAAMQSGDLAGGEYGLTKALGMWPEKSSIHYWLSVVHEQRHRDLPAAIRAMEAALALAPEQANFITRLESLRQRAG